MAHFDIVFDRKPVEELLAEGALYYDANRDLFTDEAFTLIGVSEWEPDFADRKSVV